MGQEEAPLPLFFFCSLSRFDLIYFAPKEPPPPLATLSLLLIQARTTDPQSPAATRLLLVGPPGRSYYPCGSVAMSFFGNLIDGAENCIRECLTYWPATVLSYYLAGMASVNACRSPCSSGCFCSLCYRENRGFRRIDRFVLCRD